MIIIMKNLVLSLVSILLLIVEVHSTEFENGCTQGYKKGVEINLSNQPRLTEEAKSALVKSGPVDPCIFDETPLGAEDLKIISRLKDLRNLCVIGCGLWKNNIAYFNIPSLQELNISHNQFNLTDLKSLTAARNMIVFHSSGIPIGDEGVKHLVTIIPALKEVNVSGCALKGPSLDYFLIFSSLEKVHLSLNDFSREALAAFLPKAKERNITVAF